MIFYSSVVLYFQAHDYRKDQPVSFWSEHKNTVTVSTAKSNQHEFNIKSI